MMEKLRVMKYNGRILRNLHSEGYKDLNTTLTL